jgi:hypothetical protein
MTINITGTLVPASATFGIANASDLVGGFASYASPSAIGAIASGRLILGQEAYDQSTGILYQLTSLTPGGGFANGTWIPLVIPNGGAWSPGVATVATANITLSGEQTINGVTTSASRVLVVGQNSTAANGLYTTGTGAWTYTSDANVASDYILGKQVAVLGGTYAGTIYVCNAVPATLGTNPVTFVANGTGGTSFNAASPPPIGNVAPSTAFFSQLTLSGPGLWASGVAPLDGFVSAAVTDSGTATTLSATQYNVRTIALTGALTAVRTVIIPTQTSSSYVPWWWFRNASTGGFSITISIGSGATVSLASGQTAMCWTDGTNVYISGGGAGGNTLVGTAKTAAFTASAGNDYKINTTGGTFTGTMPAVTDGAIISFIDTEASCGSSAFSVTAAGTDKVMSPATMTLSSAGGTVVCLNRNSQSVQYEGIVSATLGNYWYPRSN